jgi:hypothetical protein
MSFLLTQQPLNATRADAVVLSESLLRCARAAFAQKVADDLLAQTINKSPAPAGGTTRCHAPVVDVHPSDRSGRRRHRFADLGVRKTSP